jgi:hypothetical protein
VPPRECEYFAHCASIERELARTASSDMLAALHLELAARYDALAHSEWAKPELRLIVNDAWPGRT